MSERMQRRTSGVSFRAVVIGSIMVVANAYWLTLTSEVTWPMYLLTFVSLFFNAVFSLFLLLMGNHLLKQFAPRRSQIKFTFLPIQND